MYPGGLHLSTQVDLAVGVHPSKGLSVVRELGTDKVNQQRRSHYYSGSLGDSVLWGTLCLFTVFLDSVAVGRDSQQLFHCSVVVSTLAARWGSPWLGKCR